MLCFFVDVCSHSVSLCGHSVSLCRCFTALSSLHFLLEILFLFVVVVVISPYHPSMIMTPCLPSPIPPSSEANSTGNIKARFENIAKQKEEEDRKRAEEERAKRQVKEKQEQEEARRQIEERPKSPSPKAPSPVPAASPSPSPSPTPPVQPAAPTYQVRLIELSQKKCLLQKIEKLFFMKKIALSERVEKV